MPSRKLEISIPAAASLALLLCAVYGFRLGGGWLFFGVTLVLAVEYARPLRRLAESGLPREQKIRSTMAILTVGFLAGVAFHYAKGMFFGAGYPQNTFLPHPISRFCDFYSTHDYWTRFRFKAIGNYFPCAALFVEPFRWFVTAQKAVAVFLSLFTLFMAGYAYKHLRMGTPLESVQNVALCFASYPFLFTFHTANLEIIIFIALALFVHLYQQQRAPALTSLLLAIPIAVKLFPAVFLILVLSDRRYREILYTLGWIVVLSIVPLLLFEGGIRSGLGGYLWRMQVGQWMYKQHMVIGISGINYGHSLLTALRVLFPKQTHPSLMPRLLTPYLMFALVAFSGVAAYVIFRERSLWKKVALLIVAMNLLPYTSTDYKLLHFFIPLFLFLNSSKEERFDLSFTVLFGLLLVSKDFVFFHRYSLHTLNQVLNPLLMILMGTLIVVPGLRQKSAQEAHPEQPADEGEAQSLLPMARDSVDPSRNDRRQVA